LFLDQDTFLTPESVPADNSELHPAKSTHTRRRI
jgi:hypothetical protein